MSDDEQIILKKPFFPSVIKTFYLLVFVYSTYQAMGTLLEKSRIFLNEDIPICAYSVPQIALYAITILYVVAFSLHMLRLYLSLEELEDPFSKVHKDFIKPLGKGCKSIVERYIRSAFLLVVSLKVINFNLFNSELKGIFLYLLCLYGSMLAWDVYIWKAGRVKRKELFFSISLPGTLIAYAMWCTQLHYFGADGTKILIATLLGMMMLATFYSLLSNDWYGFIKEGLQTICDFFYKPPYYGEENETQAPPSE
jgi:hypothetical protein